MIQMLKTVSTKGKATLDSLNLPQGKQLVFFLIMLTQATVNCLFQAVTQLQSIVINLYPYGTAFINHFSLPLERLK